MSHQQPQSNAVTDAFGKAIGFAVALYTTMPAYHLSYDYFNRYALTYSHWDYRQFWELVYILCLFLVIVVTVWMALHIVLSVLKFIPKLFVLLTIRKY